MPLFRGHYITLIAQETTLAGHKRKKYAHGPPSEQTRRPHNESSTPINLQGQEERKNAGKNSWLDRSIDRSNAEFSTLGRVFLEIKRRRIFLFCFRIAISFQIR
jgi:hypothetical protein